MLCRVAEGVNPDGFTSFFCLIRLHTLYKKVMVAFRKSLLRIFTQVKEEM